MAHQGHQTRETFIAGGDMSGDQFKPVTLGSNGKITVTAAGGDADGILINKPIADGNAATVVVLGRVCVVAGGNVSPGDSLAVDGTGRFIPATSGDVILGTCIDSGVAGQLITFDFFRGGNVA